MPLPQPFHFSQSSLQDYVDCPRRFELRYIREQAWPAIAVQPILEYERQMQLGVAFHRLLHQYALGVPENELGTEIEDADLKRWWMTFQQAQPAALIGATRFTEMTLSIWLASHRLIAKYDLIALNGEAVIVVDWKTDRRRPPSEWLRNRMQSCVYPFVVVEAGASLLALDRLLPDQVTMIYWFANFPHQPEVMPYDRQTHERNRKILTRLIGEIEMRTDSDFPLTEEARQCRFCIYRSLCERGIGAGDLDGLEGDVFDADEGPDIDLEQIAEIHY